MRTGAGRDAHSFEDIRVICSKAIKHSLGVGHTSCAGAAGHAAGLSLRKSKSLDSDLLTRGEKWVGIDEGDMDHQNGE